MGKIVAIMGLARSGKDTAADYLVRHHGLVRVALADPMKRFCAQVFDFTHDQLHGNLRDAPDHRYPRLTWREGSTPETEVGVTEYLTPRFALQTLGTEWGRACYENVWIDYGLRVAHTVLEGHDYDPYRGIVLRTKPPVLFPVRGVVFSDLRFQNEFDAFKKAGALMVRIHRPGTEPVVGLPGHASERDQHVVPDTAFDVVLRNTSTLAHLYWQIAEHVVPRIGP